MAITKLSIARREERARTCKSKPSSLSAGFSACFLRCAQLKLDADRAIARPDLLSMMRKSAERRRLVRSTSVTGIDSRSQKRPGRATTRLMLRNKRGAGLAMIYSINTSARMRRANGTSSPSVYLLGYAVKM
jgi:hypothetical protein